MSLTRLPVPVTDRKRIQIEQTTKRTVEAQPRRGTNWRIEKLFNNPAEKKSRRRNDKTKGFPCDTQTHREICQRNRSPKDGEFACKVNRPWTRNQVIENPPVIKPARKEESTRREQPRILGRIEIGRTNGEIKKPAKCPIQGIRRIIMVREKLTVEDRRR